MSNKVLFLPSDGSGMNTPMQETGWTGLPANQLRNIATYLPTLSNNMDTTGGNGEVSIEEFSIPSPWSRFILFETAFRNSGLNSLYKRIRNEWRGLIATVALRDVRGIDIKFKEVSRMSFRGGLGKVLNDSAPTNSIYDYEKSWDKLYFIVMDDKHIIGMLSNSTIVCTPYEYSFQTMTALEQKLTWFKYGAFLDPLDPSDPTVVLHHEYAEALVLWLRKTKADLPYSNGDLQLVSAVTGEIDAYIEDIERAHRDLSHSGFSIIPADSEYEGVRSLAAATVRRNAGQTSDLAIYKHENCILIANKLWNIDRNHENADRIRVFNSKTFRDFPRSFQSKSTMLGNMAIPEGMVVYNAEDLLKDEIHIVDMGTDGDAFDDTGAEGDPATYRSSIFYNGSACSVIWPVNDMIFDFMSPYELKDSISATVDSDNTVEIKIKIKVVGPAFLKNGEDYKILEITKKYSGRQQSVGNTTNNNPGRITIIHGVNAFPIVAVWPHQRYRNYDFREEAGKNNIWKKYYTFISKDRNIEYDMIPEHYDLEKTYIFDKDNTINSPITAFPYTTNMVAFSTEFPEYVSVEKRDLDDRDRFHRVGIVFMKQPGTVLIESSKKWDVGLDFGTTSTTVFRDNGVNKEFVRFGRIYRKSLQGGGSYDPKLSRDSSPDGLYFLTCGFNEPAYREFLPAGYFEKNMYLSIYQSLRSVSDGEEGLELKSFCDGHVFYHKPDEEFNIKSKYSQHLHKNLKWGGSEETKAARKYIMQILMQICQRAASNGVGELNWRFSYPSALGYEKKKSYIESVENALKELEKDTGMKMNINAIKHTTESMASSLFFRNLHGNERPLPNEAYVCVDMGGATTDISIWKSADGKPNKLQSSIKFASRNIFLETLCGFKSLVNKLSIKNVEFENYDLSDCISQIEYTLFDNEEGINNQRLHLKGEDAEYRDFIQLVSIGFLGILYYVNMQLEYLSDQGELNDISNVKIFLSGNGSKLYNWITDIIEEKRIESSLTEELAHLGISKVQVIVKEDTLKTEAAQGLLYFNENYADDHLEKLISGEVFEYKPKEGTSTEMRWSEDLLAGSILNDFLSGDAEIKPDSKFDSIHRFLDFYSDLFSKPGAKIQPGLDKAARNTLVGKVQQKINECRDSKRIDSLFILSVYAYLEMKRDER